MKLSQDIKMTINNWENYYAISGQVTWSLKNGLMKWNNLDLYENKPFGNNMMHI